MSRRLSVIAVALLVASAGWAAEEEPDRVTVQHMLIGYKRSVRGKKLDRTKTEARALAESLYERALAGEDFDALVKEYTDDSYPGIYPMTNQGVPRRSDARQRSEMAIGFGDVAFSLEIGEVGFCKQHGAKSPYGWHIIKRLE